LNLRDPIGDLAAPFAPLTAWAKSLPRGGAIADLHRAILPTLHG
jgi:hypothetical protein